MKSVGDLSVRGAPIPSIQWTAGSVGCTNSADSQTGLGAACWGKKVFQLQGSASAPCDVLTRRWSLTKRACATSYTPAAPGVVSAVLDECSIQYKCEWSVTKFPCGFATDPKFVAPQGGPGPVTLLTEGSKIPAAGDSTRQMCNAQFYCRSPGTYTLQLMVTDDCTRSISTTTVTCRCDSTPNVRIFAKDGLVSLYKCDATVRNFQAISVEAIVSKADFQGLANCTATRSTAAPTLSRAVSSCCPVITTCPQWYEPSSWMCRPCLQSSAR